MLNNYRSSCITANDYWSVLKSYANGQQKNGYSWIGENLDADTGYWYTDLPARSYHYNHSSYADLIITGLVGIRPADNDDSVVINPLLPDDAIESFVLENVCYRGKYVTVVYDKNGTEYGIGQGLSVFINGKLSAYSKQITGLVVSLNS